MAGGRMTALVFVPYQWRSQWRELRQRGAWRGANVATVTMLGLMGLGLQVALTLFAWLALSGDEPLLGQTLTEAGLAGVLLGWLFLPLLVSGITGAGAGVTLARLAQFPLTSLQLLAVGILGSLLQPVYWVLIAASLVALIPLLHLPAPHLGILAGVIYLLDAAVLSWALSLVGTAVASSRRGREIALTVVAVLLFGSFPLLHGDVANQAGVITYSLFDHTFLLLDINTETGLLATLSDWLPASLVGRIGRGEEPWPPFFLLVAGLGAGLGLSVLSLRRLMTQPAEGMGGRRARQASIGRLPGLPVALGVLTVKELRYLLRTLDALLGFGFGIIGGIWMLLRPGDSLPVFIFCLPVIVLNEMVMPLNVFGLDGRAVDRYRLLPLTGRQVMLSKNLAFLLLVGCEIAVPVLVGFWRLGISFTLAGVSGCLAATLASMAWGNQTSVRAPAPRAFFNFDSKEQAGGSLSILGVTVLWGVPLLVGLATHSWGPAAVLAGQLVLLPAAGAVYLLSLKNAGRKFEERAEQMRSLLAGPG